MVHHVAFQCHLTGPLFASAFPDFPVVVIHCLPNVCYCHVIPSVLYGAPKLAAESFRPVLASYSQYPFLLLIVPQFFFSHPLHVILDKLSIKMPCRPWQKGLRTLARPISHSLPVFEAVAIDSSRQLQPQETAYQKSLFLAFLRPFLQISQLQNTPFLSFLFKSIELQTKELGDANILSIFLPQLPWKKHFFLEFQQIIFSSCYINIRKILTNLIDLFFLSFLGRERGGEKKSSHHQWVFQGRGDRA